MSGDGDQIDNKMPEAEYPSSSDEGAWQAPSEPFDRWAAGSDGFSQVPFEPETPDETARRFGVASSLGIAFFASVIFGLLLGWIADWVFGTRPWAIVAGIVFGSFVGFLQFFRISSKIFKNQSSGPSVRPLMDRQDDDLHD